MKNLQQQLNETIFHLRPHHGKPHLNLTILDR